jgi:hypothetical protein
MWQNRYQEGADFWKLILIGAIIAGVFTSAVALVICFFGKAGSMKLILASLSGLVTIGFMYMLVGLYNFVSWAAVKLAGYIKRSTGEKDYYFDRTSDSGNEE